MSTTTKRILLITYTLISVTFLTFGQGTFANLDFEFVIQPLVPGPGGTVAASNAIPDWTTYVGAGADSGVWYNDITLDAAGVSLFSSGSGRPIVQGNYSIYLQSATLFGTGGSAGIGQSGTIPSDAQSLFFVADSSALHITFGGQSIPTFAIGSYNGFSLYGGDVSGFAGQTGILLFTCPQLNGNRQQVLLDAISFSTVGVPEPSVISLIGLGLLGLGWHLRRERIE